MIIYTGVGFVVINVICKDSASRSYDTKPPCYCYKHNDHPQDNYNHAQDHHAQDHHGNDHGQDHHDNDHRHDHHTNDQVHHENDDGQALVRSCHRLERLDLEECVLLTDTSISQVNIHIININI